MPQDLTVLERCTAWNPDNLNHASYEEQTTIKLFNVCFLLDTIILTFDLQPYLFGRCSVRSEGAFINSFFASSVVVSVCCCLDMW